jgi:hypothetical protein
MFDVTNGDGKDKWTAYISREIFTISMVQYVSVYGRRWKVLESTVNARNCISKEFPRRYCSSTENSPAEMDLSLRITPRNKCEDLLGSNFYRTTYIEDAGPTLKVNQVVPPRLLPYLAIRNNTIHIERLRSVADQLPDPLSNQHRLQQSDRGRKSIRFGRL